MQYSKSTKMIKWIIKKTFKKLYVGFSRGHGQIRLYNYVLKDTFSGLDSKFDFKYDFN